MRCSGHGNGHDPQEQRGNHRQGDQVEGAEKLQHQLGCLGTAETCPPGIPALAKQGVQNLFAAIGFQEYFRGCR